MLVNAHRHIDLFTAVLVAHHDAVFSRIFRLHVVDGDGADLGLLGDGELGLIKDLLVVPKPRDLWGWFTVDEARQTQRLKRGKENMK